MLSNTYNEELEAARRATLLTPVDLASRWGIRPASLATMRSQHRGPDYVKLSGGAVRYRLTDIVRFEAANTVHVARELVDA